MVAKGGAWWSQNRRTAALRQSVALKQCDGGGERGPWWLGLREAVTGVRWWRFGGLGSYARWRTMGGWVRNPCVWGKEPVRWREAMGLGSSGGGRGRGKGKFMAVVGGHGWPHTAVQGVEMGKNPFWLLTAERRGRLREGVVGGSWLACQREGINVRDPGLIPKH